MNAEHTPEAAIERIKEVADEPDAPETIFVQLHASCARKEVLLTDWSKVPYNEIRDTLITVSLLQYEVLDRLVGRNRQMMTALPRQ